MTATTGQLLLLVGPAGAGKSTWTTRHHTPTEIINRDAYRATVADDENDQDATTDADRVMRAIVAARLSRGLTCVLDITGHPDDRAAYAALGHQHHARLTLVIFNVPIGVCLARQATRPGPRPGRRWGRAVPEAAIRAQRAETEAVYDTVLYLAGGDHGDYLSRPDVAVWHSARIVGPLGQDWGTHTLLGTTR